MSIESTTLSLVDELRNIAKEYQKEQNPEIFNKRWLKIARIIGFETVDDFLSNNFKEVSDDIRTTEKS
jgi:hypothetical protein